MRGERVRVLSAGQRAAHVLLSLGVEIEAMLLPSLIVLDSS